jgi:hypothetical protein
MRAFGAAREPEGKTQQLASAVAVSNGVRKFGREGGA